MPKVSVIIPTYNSARYLVEALDSVFRQTMGDYEVIVVDDGSEDETAAVLAGYGERVRYCRQENQGPAAARNRGIALAAGEYLAFLDADDLLVPDHLHELSSFLDDCPELGMVFADCAFFSATGVVAASGLVTTRVPAIPVRDCGSGRRIFERRILRELAWGSFIPTCTAMIRREVFDAVGGYDVSFRNGEDRDLWLRIDAAFLIGYIFRPLARVRIHDANTTNPRNAVAMLKDRLAVTKKAAQSRPSMTDGEKRAIRQCLAKTCFDLGWEYRRNDNRDGARACFAESLRYAPLSLKHWLNFCRASIEKILH